MAEKSLNAYSSNNSMPLVKVMKKHLLCVMNPFDKICVAKEIDCLAFAFLDNTRFVYTIYNRMFERDSNSDQISSIGRWKKTDSKTALQINLQNGSMGVKWFHDAKPWYLKRCQGKESSKIR